jgi:hypothetical protein
MVMLTFGAIVTLVLGLCCLLDAIVDAVSGLMWLAQAIASAVCLILFSGFYAAMVLVP